MDENNKALEDAANALNAAAEASNAPVEAVAEDIKVEETPVEAPVENSAAEMPAEPAVEAPIAEPAPVAPAATVIEAQNTSAPAAPAVKAEGKKSKKGLIIGCSVGAVAILGLGGLGVAYAIDNQSDNIALSAIADFLSTKQRTVDGYIEYSINEDDDDDKYYVNSTDKCTKTDCIVAAPKTVTNARIDINSKVDNGNNADTSVTFTVTYGGTDYKLTLGSVVMKDYTLYISISNLKETIKSVLAEAESTK
jgi:hypothetical protein